MLAHSFIRKRLYKKRNERTHSVIDLANQDERNIYVLT